jgi:hypothetical protein
MPHTSEKRKKKRKKEGKKKKKKKKERGRKDIWWEWRRCVHLLLSLSLFVFYFIFFFLFFVLFNALACDGCHVGGLRDVALVVGLEDTDLPTQLADGGLLVLQLSVGQLQQKEKKRRKKGTQHWARLEGAEWKALLFSHPWKTNWWAKEDLQLALESGEPPHHGAHQIAVGHWLGRSHLLHPVGDDIARVQARDLAGDRMTWSACERSRMQPFLLHLSPGQTCPARIPWALGREANACPSAAELACLCQASTTGPTFKGSGC